VAGGAVPGTARGGPRALEAALEDDARERQREEQRQSGSTEAAKQREHEEEEGKISLRLQPMSDEDRGGGHAGGHEAVGTVICRWRQNWGYRSELMAVGNHSSRGLKRAMRGRDADKWGHLV
jgi:hypothetical protein